MARPLKYKERVQNISIALEPNVIRWLEKEAYKKHMSRNEYIAHIIKVFMSIKGDLDGI